MEEPKTMVDAPPAPETSTTSEDIDLFGDDISETVAPPASTAVSKEAAPSEAPAGTTHMEAQSEAVVIEESVSPEQMSEQTDSEPTVIETNLQGAAEEANKMSILEAEQTDAFGDVNALDAFSAPLKQTKGLPSLEMLRVPSPVPLATHSASLFGDVSQTVPPASPAASLFGDVTTAPPASPATSLFGDVPQSVPPASPAADLFGDAPKAVPPPSPAPVGTGSSGFDIFDGESAKVAPAPSGADSTGAALFGTATPAPNVGMSLFGAGNEPTLDIFAETRFDKVAVDESDELHVDPFATTVRAASPWGDTGESGGAAAEGFGFGDSGGFDSFLAMKSRLRSRSRRRAEPLARPRDSDDEPMTVVIKCVLGCRAGLVAMTLS
ncbi:hypothetical protein C7M84_016757 [Penaeus vannamei]|uniref:Uncharacterized protein n=1 Tax=Penaeus vannamei TaxID=6689 RepID=A0A3R7M285_PENVA|nr:hypothetical protein C7M84_016757 [Penaeus vannamei]